MDLPTLEMRIARSENLPIISEVAVSILRLAKDENTAARTYVKVIERDPALAAKVLRIASSPAYGVGDVPSISRAISVLGISHLKNLAISLSYQQSMETRSKAEEFNSIDSWRHSLATASAAQILATLVCPERAEELYLAGLLHDVGLLAMDKFCPAILNLAIRRARSEKVPLHVAETEANGYDHSAVGALLVERWGLKKSIQSAIKYHLCPAEADDEIELACILAASNHIAFEAGFHNNSEMPDEGFDQMALGIVGIPAEQYLTICDVVRNEIAKVETAFRVAPQSRAA